MNKLDYCIMRILLFALLTAVLICGMAGCGKEDHDIETQQSNFLSFFKSNNLQDTATFKDTTMYNGVFRDIFFRNTGTEALLETGDSAAIYYSGYIFSSSYTHGEGALFTTNILQDAVDAGFQTDGIRTEPFDIQLGDKSLIRGLHYGLYGCSEGDSVRVFITSDLAYDPNGAGIVDPGTPVVFKIFIQSVTKASSN